ncbi:hypothetical protein ACMXYX_02470 [Neptuniibacter sp. QD72_48]
MATSIAQVIKGDETLSLTENKSTHIPIDAAHSLVNSPLSLIALE